RRARRSSSSTRARRQTDTEARFRGETGPRCHSRPHFEPTMADPVTFLESPDPASGPGAEPAEALVIDDADRYGRLRLIPWWRQEKLAAARVLVVGAGALGNEVLKNLALLGVGTTYVIDLDCVEPSNLSRSVLFRAEDGGRPKAEVAARRAREINPEVTIHPLHGDV